MMNRRHILKMAMSGTAFLSLRPLFAQGSDEIDYEDIEAPLPNYRLFGTQPALGAEEQQARKILENAPKGQTLLETARYFEKIDIKNEDGHMYNAQWPTRWNPTIVGFYQAANVNESYIYRKGDTIDWCAAFINWCLRQGGYEQTNSAMSGSFRLGKGLGKATTNPKPGDIIVFKKADPQEAKVGFGHVGIFVAEAPGGFNVLGGNQKAGKRYSSVNTTFLPESSDRLVFDSIRSFDTIPRIKPSA
ncbi:CHAP domain-containing protein [Achromobacter denitrificans]|uniref:CHAP domain-containing protein n=2 Tax=Achromobacter denitrificans TaxID=32002 RepID=UPI00209526D2|nr:CHAP domain-containing protein [Achromobacter denitrificans]MDX3878473.1 CHAP domain-containing protein [Achromobacter sp.]